MKVSEGALVKRINRRLRPKGQMLKKSRGERARQDVGDFYILNPDRNVLLWTHVNLGAKAQEMGAVSAGEQLVS